MIADRILRCHGPKIDHIRIVAVHDDPCLRKIVGEQGFGPAGRSTFCSPCRLSIARQTVNKHDTRIANQLRRLQITTARGVLTQWLHRLGRDSLSASLRLGEARAVD